MCLFIPHWQSSGPDFGALNLLPRRCVALIEKLTALWFYFGRMSVAPRPPRPAVQCDGAKNRAERGIGTLTFVGVKFCPSANDQFPQSGFGTSETALERAHVHVWLKKLVVVAPTVLGVIHRKIGILHQDFRLGPVEESEAALQQMRFSNERPQLMFVLSGMRRTWC
jgi:hypothetical protein